MSFCNIIACPICNKLVDINRINAHIDSNCKSYLLQKQKQKHTVKKTQSNLTQYFNIKSKCSKEVIIANSCKNTKKRSRNELEMDMHDHISSPKKRIKLSHKQTMKMDEKEGKERERFNSNNTFEYEPFECKANACIELMQFNDIHKDNVKCIHFDQHIVGKKFCENKSYTTYDLNSHNINSDYLYLDLIHEYDNKVDSDAVAIVKCRPTDPLSITGMGYLPRTISGYILNLMKNQNVNVSVYKIQNTKCNTDNIQSVRVHIVVLCKHDDMDEIMDTIYNLKVIVNENKHKKDVYFDILSSILISNYKKYTHLFEENELDGLNKMIKWKDTDETKDALKLLSRLMLRKVKWFKRSALKYDEVEDMDHAICILIDNGILIQSQQDGGDITQELLKCVGKTILVELSNKIGCKMKKNGIHCDALIQSIMHQMNTQKTIFGVKLCNNATFVKKCHSIIGAFICMTSFALDLLNKCQLLFYLDIHTTIQDTVLSHIGFKKYPKYKICNACNAESVIFPTKEIFVEYTNALKFKSEYDEMYTVYMNNHENEEALMNKIKECEEQVMKIVKQQYSSHSVNNSINCFVSSYRDIKIYCRVLHRGVSDIIEKLANKQYELCCTIYQQLLSAQPYSYKRGKWYCRLALLLHHHLKKYTVAYSVCYDGLKDDYVEISYRNELIKRYRKLHKHLGFKTKLEIPSTNTWNDCEDFIDSSTFKYIVIGSKPFNCEPGEKSRFFGFDDSVVSVEELVLQYFNDEANGNWNGIHCEGSVYRMVFAVFMWDIIFCDNVRFVFQTEYQDAPLDMNTEWFYLNRKELIESYVDVLASFSDADIENVVNNIYSEHCGECVIGVYWDKYDLNELIQICKSIGGFAIGQICLLLAKNYRFWSGGLPDLFLWRKKNDEHHEFECKIVEVKGPRDHLSEKQICWISYLTKYAKLNVFVAKIKEEF